MHRVRRFCLTSAVLVSAVVGTGCAERITSPAALDRPTGDFVPAVGSVGQISAGGYHNCAIKTDGTVVCWGRNFGGQSTPPAGLVAVQLSSGQNHSCAVKADGTVVCWGDNLAGQRDIPPGLLASQVDAGGNHTCAVRLDATVVCWGATYAPDDKGQTVVPVGLTDVLEVIAGGEYSCARKTDGTVVCWGTNQNGRLDVPGGLLATQLSAGTLHTCALRSDGAPACWGYFRLAALPLGIVASQISAGGAHTCALNTDLTVRCWGFDGNLLPEAQADFGQTIVPLGLGPVAQVSSGGFHTCALKFDGTVVCWGFNDTNQTDVPPGLNLITTQPQVITFTSMPPSAAFVGGTYEVAATGGGSGNPVTFGSLSSTICGVTGSIVEFLAAGTCTIAADQSGSANYYAAPQQTQSMLVVEVNVAPVVTAVILPAGPVPVGAAIGISAPFTDGNALDSHSATVFWDDGATTVASIVEASGSGTVSANHTFVEAGVYTVGVSVSDGSLTGTRSSVLDMPAYAVVYDPDAGFVTGGGWITSPEGAYVANPGLTGKASFGFVSRYKKGATVPSGNTEFQFHTASLNFSSSDYQWLVVAGARAQFKGTGVVNGAGIYGFLLSAVDGQVPGGGGVDRFRIKIWDLATGAVVYDNQMGSADDAEAGSSLGGGSIVIHQ